MADAIQDVVEYAVGEQVWAKCHGFPWWPAKILAETNLPERLSKMARMPDSIPCIFYGTHDYCFVKRANLLPYDQPPAEAKKTPKGLQKAIDECVNQPDAVDFDFVTPTDVFVPAADKIESEEEQEAAEAGEIVYETKVFTTRKRRKSSTSKKSSAAGDDSKEQEAEAVEEDNLQPRKKVKRASRVGLPPPLPEEVYQFFEQEEAPPPPPPPKSPQETLFLLRHRLQRIFLGAKMKVEDFPKVDSIMTQVENFQVTVDLLKETKIGKVMRRIAGMNFEEEPANVLSRSKALVEKWRVLISSSSGEVDKKASETEDADKLINFDNAMVVDDKENAAENSPKSSGEEGAAVDAGTAKATKALKVTAEGELIEEEVVVKVEKAMTSKSVKVSADGEFKTVKVDKVKASKTDTVATTKSVKVTSVQSSDVAEKVQKPKVQKETKSKKEADKEVHAVAAA